MSKFNIINAPLLIQNIWSKRKLRDSNIFAGINEDDCAIINLNNHIIGISTDYLNSRPICLELDLATYYDLGRLTAASNISDLLGSGFKPHSFMLGIMLKRIVSKNEFIEFIDGLKYELDKINVPLIGGDTKHGEENAFLGIAIGMADNMSELFLKNRAKEGDRIYSSGNLGSVAASVAFLKSKFKNAKKYEELKQWACNKIINPVLPYNTSKLISNLKLSIAGTDISDGLSTDLYDLCQTSKVGAIINIQSLPIEENAKKIALLLNIEPWKLPFLSGGDFQFIFTVMKSETKSIEKLKCVEIGKIINEKTVYLSDENNLIPLDKFGHNDSSNLTFAEEISGNLDKLKL